jgi:hypothetical protein
MTKAKPNLKNRVAPEVEARRAACDAKQGRPPKPPEDDPPPTRQSPPPHR